MTLSIIAETDDYVLQSCKVSGHNLLIRKEDNGVVYLSDHDANILSECVDDLITFDSIANNYKFLDLTQEKSV